MTYCSHCGEKLTGTEKFCKKCGNPVFTQTTSQTNNNNKSDSFQSKDTETNSSRTENDAFHYYEKERSTQQENSNTESFTQKLNDYIGNKGSSILNWKDLFTNVFKSHTTDEAESVFICGTNNTTPPISEALSTWTKPWLYSRIFVLFFCTFTLLTICWKSFMNINVIPGIMFIGAFAIPFTTLVLFLEMNVFRNISFYTVIKTFFIGGCLSLFATLTLYSILEWDISDFSFINAATISIVEESGKAMVIYSLLKHAPQYKYVLNALLIGASVGAGFAAFESSGYAFMVLLSNLNDSNPIDCMLDNIYLRSFLSPGGHIAWAAISSTAFIIAKDKGPLNTDILKKKKFWKIFIIPIAFHTLWDWEAFARIGADIYLAYWILLIGVWLVIIALINMGLNEVKRLKKSDHEKMSAM